MVFFIFLDRVSYLPQDFLAGDYETIVRARAVLKISSKYLGYFVVEIHARRVMDVYALSRHARYNNE